MSIARFEDYKPMLVSHPMDAARLIDDLMNRINTSWNDFATLENSRHLASHDLKTHFYELKKIISETHSPNSKNHYLKSLEDSYNKIQSMAMDRQFILKDNLDPLTRMGAQGVITNLVINLLESIMALKLQLSKEYQEASSIEKEEKTKTPESRRISKSKPEMTILSEKEKKQDKILVPGHVMNIMLDQLDYDNLDKKSSHGEVSLVPTLFNAKKQKIERLKHLLTAIANGEFDNVKEMIEKPPLLLLDKLEENDYVTTLSGQRANHGTALRTALAGEDTQMAAMIKAKLIKIANEDVANEQYHKQFPTGWEATEEEKWAPIFDQLETLTQAIRYAKLDAEQDDMNDIISSGDPQYKLTVRDGSYLAIELATFRSLLEAKLNEIATTGRQFNPKLLLRAFKIYDGYFGKYFGQNCSDPRAMLFLQQVIGTTQCVLPPPWVQAFCTGLCTTEEKLQTNIPQDRSLKIHLFDNERKKWVSSDFYPLSRSRVGFDYAIYGGSPRQRDWLSRGVWECSKLMSVKNKVHTDTYTPTPKH